MATFTARLSARCGVRAAVLAAAVLVVALVTPAKASTASPRPIDPPVGVGYGWPVKPFFTQHPVRGMFGDPRIGVTPDGLSKQFHFGVDVSAPNGTPVYATMSGSISIHPLHSDVVLIDGPGGVEFSYWHIVPVVRGGEHAVAYRTLIGHVERPWAHVHFSEARYGRYVNPLRTGAMGPYVDHTKPMVGAVELEHGGRPVRLASAHGTLDLVAEVSDETPLAVPHPWSDMPVMPTLVRWRLLGARRAITGWATAVDFTWTIPSAGAFDEVFAQWTRQNHPNHRGRYRIYLVHGWSSELVPDGVYRVEVEATDIRGNRTRAAFRMTVANTQ
jgi:hypothetical protein